MKSDNNKRSTSRTSDVLAFCGDLMGEFSTGVFYACLEGLAIRLKLTILLRSNFMAFSARVGTDFGTLFSEYLLVWMRFGLIYFLGF